jgi:hypothetical protein
MWQICSASAMCDNAVILSQDVPSLSGIRRVRRCRQDAPIALPATVFACTFGGQAVHTRSTERLIGRISCVFEVTPAFLLGPALNAVGFG